MNLEAEGQRMLWGTVESLELLLPELPFTGVREGLEVRNTPNSEPFPDSSRGFV